MNFLQLLPQHLLVDQPFPNFSFNRGHDLSCDWLLMQQVCLLSSWDIAPLSRQRKEGLKMVMINVCWPPWHKKNYYHCWINDWFQGEISQTYKVQSNFTDWYIEILHDNPLIKMPHELIDQFGDEPTLFQIMAWCYNARSHYLNLCWPRSQTLTGKALKLKYHSSGVTGRPLILHTPHTSSYVFLVLSYWYRINHDAM